MFCVDVLQDGMLALGVFVATFSVLTARSIARKKQSADLLLASRGDQLLHAGHAAIRNYYDAGDKNIRVLATPEHFEGSEARAVRYVLNHYEVVSIGIRAGIYDEEMIKNCWYTEVVQTYDKTVPLIAAARGRSPTSTVLQEFEWLAKRWRRRPLKLRPAT
jgi:hypothetical protein